MIEKVIHIGPIKTQGGIASVLESYQRLFGIPNSNIWNSYNSGFISSLFLLLKICVRILFFPPSHISLYHLHPSQNGSFFRKYLIFCCLKFRKKKVIVHLHGSRFQSFFLKSPVWVRKNIVYFLVHSDQVIAITNQMKLFLNEHVPEIRHIVVIPNPCESFIDVLPEKEPRNEIRFIFSGCYGQRKGVYDLIDAFGKANFQKQVTLDLFGDGEVKQVLERVKSSPCADKIYVSMWLEHSVYLKKLSKYDVLILPSYAETFGMSLVEAMGFGIPVISTFSGGISDVVENGKTGILVQAGDIPALTQALEKIASDSDFRLQLGRNAWHDVKKRFSKTIVFEKLESMYLDVLNHANEI